LELEPGWEAAPVDRPLVIAVHGFYSNRDRAGALLKGAQDKGFPTGNFEYASDRPIEESAGLLAQNLKCIADKQPERRVALVTHSMGGVVARSVVENPELDPGNVTRLVMIAPPNHGSALAGLALRVRPTAEMDELEAQAATRWGRAAVLALVGPAAQQLQPGSPFLTELNARPRNPRVRYTIFLGTKAALPAKLADAAEKAVDETDQRWRWTRWLGEDFRERLSELPEVRNGLGDSVVSVESGRLEGVDDVVLLPFRHNEPLWDPDEPAVEQLSQEVMKRLTAE
jgi:pimeloyl-ACP methyl ester carboxylesterase